MGTRDNGHQGEWKRGFWDNHGGGCSRAHGASSRVSGRGLSPAGLKFIITETQHRLRAEPGVGRGQTTFLTGGLHSRPGVSLSRAQRGRGALKVKHRGR